MMVPKSLLLSTALVPMIWGTTYLTTTELLPPHRPMLTAALRALPVGLLLLAFCRRLPRGAWWWKAAVLGALNIGLSFTFLFIAAYRLPGGIAATIGAVQPLLVVMVGWPLLGLRPAARTLVAGLAGIAGVAALVLGADGALDPIGVAAVVGLAVVMAFGVVLTKRWGSPVPLPAFTGWQLTAGGLMLVPVALLVEGPPPALTATNVGGYLYLGLIGTGLAYYLWFRGIARLPVASVAFLALLSPIVATLAGLVVRHQTLSLPQLGGMAVVFGSIVLAQMASGPAPGAARRRIVTPVREDCAAPV